ncbi:MAG: hypothetical protein ACJAS1_007137 [Oleiphilaceae bacterium]|jgi:hypothetical protein
MSNNDRWLVKDKGWMKERKVQWNDIYLRLVQSEKFTKKQLKTVESFFLRGKEPKWDIAFDNDPIPLLFRLWFDPDQSEGNWEIIRNSVLSYPAPMAIDETLRESFEILEEANDHVTYSGLHNTPESFMGGLESRIYKFMHGPAESPGIIKYQDGEYAVTRLFHTGYYLNNYEWLHQQKLANKYKLNQYKLEYWYQALSDDDCAKLEKLKPSGESRLGSVLLYLEKVQEYKSLPEDSIDEARASYCEKVREILDNRPLPEKMRQWWEEAKTKVDGKVS